jgi:protein ImuB
MLWLCILLPPLEPAALRNLALWALQWSSQVSPCMPAGGSGLATLWLEIGASRQLFGSTDALRAGIAAELATLGYRAALGVAPTPQGAALLARAGNSGATSHAGAGHTHNAVTLTELRALLEPLPLSLLALAPEQLAALRSTGLRAIGELLALPLAALAQRLGPDASNYLQRLCGQAPEPLRMLQAPAQFFSRCEFPYAVTDATALLFPLQRLLAGLQGYLRSLDRAVQRYTLLLEHRQGASTRLEIGLARPTRETAQLLAVARERLAALALAAPVQALALEAQEFLQPLVQQLDCFSHSAQHSEQLQTAIDRLVARLGGTAVQTLRCAADHRPERAWTALAAQHSVSTPAALAPTVAAATPLLRPCWLLPEPCGIAVPQELLAGPERIESGWWDGADIARDYYLARGAAGARWWVYRDLRTGTWHLHGLWA